MPKDLNRLLMPEPERIRHMRVGENGLEKIGLHRGDLLIIDVTATPSPGSIVVMVITGCVSGPDFHFHHPREVDVYGVVTHSIRQLYPLPRRKLPARPPPPAPDAPRFFYGRPG